MKRPKSNAVKTFAGFGMAMSAASVATDVDAAVVNLTSNVNTVANGSSISFNLAGGGVSFNLGILNFATGSGFDYFTGGVRHANVSSTISAGDNFYYGLAFAGTGTGIRHFGFLNPVGNLGWMSWNFVQNGPATFLSAAAETNVGQSIHVAPVVAPVPLPATLPLMAAGLLALGAPGLRRRRKAKADALAAA